MTSEERDALQEGLIEEAKRLKDALGLDSIEIVATYVEEDGSTSLIPAGFGNFHARNDSIRELLMQRDERVREHARRTYDD